MWEAVQSVETFAGCCTIIEATCPELVVLENVPKIDANPPPGQADESLV